MTAVLPTKLAQVQAQVGSLSDGSILTDVPDVEVHEDRQRSKGCHPQPGQHEDVGQQDELSTQKSKVRVQLEDRTDLTVSQLVSTVSSAVSV